MSQTRAPSRVADDLAELGIRAADGIAPSAEDTAVPVLPENWEALELFLELATQWVYDTGDGDRDRCRGLSYPAVYGHPRYARLDFDTQEARLKQIRLLEIGALRAMKD
ncbi:DUF1799 domain-containing protein [Halomonas sabkhae]|uniref:DUF1799 domain-containing protein n=1 Tax=Halomonas sabkhae TaxID=626223 RepID=UPI0025B5A8DA|nr:DUF1799 domain-containing protein [Halomonas sabkhae]MDN3524357.1 DUF1799 domain-containing protein [Halomonas sabkhae]